MSKPGVETGGSRGTQEDRRISEDQGFRIPVSCSNEQRLKIALKPAKRRRRRIIILLDPTRLILDHPSALPGVS